MKIRKAFTLLELIVVLIIVGVLATVSIPTFLTSIEKSHGQDAQNNLMAIYAAQLNYYNTNGAGSYYTASPAATCSAASIADDATMRDSSHLNLSTVTNGMNFCCTTGGNGFTCYAGRQGNSNFFFTMTNNPIVLSGAAASRNPLCSSTSNPGYCP